MLMLHLPGYNESEEFDTIIWVRYALDKDLINNILNHNIFYYKLREYVCYFPKFI